MGADPVGPKCSTIQRQVMAPDATASIGWRRGHAIPVSLLALGIACASPPPVEFDGTWSGHTGEGHAVNFRVSEGAVVNLSIEIRGGMCGGSVGWDGPVRIRDARFAIDAGGREKQFGASTKVQLSGTFESNHSISGVLDAGSNKGSLAPGCFADARGSWRASRDAWREEQVQRLDALRVAIQDDRPDEAMRLIDGIEDHNVLVSFPPPMSVAVQKGHVRIVEALLKAGASPDRGFLNSPLRVAATHGDLATMRALVDGGANKKDFDGALLGACHGGHLDAVTWLLDLGANVNTFTNDDAGRWGRPLLIAIDEGRADLVQLLLARGADPSLEDGDHANALTHARRKGDRRIIALLNAHKPEGGA